jgi:hypothetical protein
MTLSIPESLNTNFTNAALNDFESDELFLTSFEKLSNIEFITSTFANKAFAHRLISKNDIIINDTTVELTFYSYITSSESRYDDREFKNLLIDSDAARKSIEEMRQFKVLQRINDIKLNKSDQLVFKFGIEDIKSIDSIELEISLETIIFHIVEINISFLLFLTDLDRSSVYFNNLTNELMQDRSSTNHSTIIILQINMKNNRYAKNDRYSVIRRYGHAFLMWKILIHSLIVESLDENPCYLIDVELRRLHRRFDHFSTRRL